MRLFQNRRRFLAALVTGSVTFVTGCTGRLEAESDDNGDGKEALSNQEADKDEEPEPSKQMELKWSTSSDWADAQKREGIGNTTAGERDTETLALGYDPTAEPISEFDAFWPLDEDDPNADVFADVLGDADLSHDPDQWGFTDDIDPSTPGLLGGTSVEFSGDDAILHKGIPIDPAEDWTIGLWVWFDGPEDQPQSNAMMLESLADKDGEALGLMPNVDPPAFKIGSVNNTPGYGTKIDRQRWHFHVLRYQASNNKVQGYLDGEFDYSIQPEDSPEEWIPKLHDVTLGRRYVSAMDKIFNGRLDSAWMTQGLLSEDDIQRLYNIVENGEGRLITAPKSAAQEAVNLEVTAEIPDDTAISVTINQDATGDGTNDISQTINLRDSVKSYELDGFEASDDGTYWVTIELKTSEREVTPRIESIIIH